MADIYLKRKDDNLIPADEYSLEKIRKLSEEETYKVPIKKVRNYQFHKKFFSLINLLWDNSPMNMPFRTFRYYVIAKSGHGQIIDNLLIADSIAFDKMDELEFEELYNDILDFGIEHIGADKEMIEKQLIGYL